MKASFSRLSVLVWALLALIIMPVRSFAVLPEPNHSGRYYVSGTSIMAISCLEVAVTHKALIRVVADTSLSSIAVSNTLPDPVVNFVGPTVNGVPTGVIPDRLASGDLDTYTQRVGAFPLVPGSHDWQGVYTLNPGAYSILVSSVGGHSGNVMVEVYWIDYDQEIVMPLPTLTSVLLYRDGTTLLHVQRNDNANTEAARMSIIYGDGNSTLVPSSNNQSWDLVHKYPASGTYVVQIQLLGTFHSSRILTINLTLSGIAPP